MTSARLERLSPPPEESIISFARGTNLQGSSYSVSSELLALLPPNCRPRRVLEKKKGFYFKLLRPSYRTTGLTARSLSSERAFGPLGKTPVPVRQDGETFAAMRRFAAGAAAGFE